MEDDVKVKSLGWAVRVGVTVGGTWICAGCGAYTATATDGAIFRQSATIPDPSLSALRASASRDLPCESSEVDIRRLDPERQYAVTGCGWRVLYRVLTPSLTSKRVELLSRTPLPPGREAPQLSLRPG